MTRQNLEKASEYLRLSEVFFKFTIPRYCNYGLSASVEYINLAKGVLTAEEEKMIRDILTSATTREASKYQQKFDEV